MLAKIRTREHVRAKGNIFGGLSAYIGQESKALRIDHAVHISSPQSAASSLQALADRVPRIHNPLHHHVLSWRRPDQLSHDEIMGCARRSLDALGLDPKRYLWIAAIHGDTDHQHVHVLANRIDPDTLRANTLRLNYKTLDRFCRQEERDHGWAAAPGSHVVDAAGAVVPATRRYADRSPIAGIALDQEARTGFQSFQRWVGDEPASACAEALRATPSWETLHATLAEFNIGYALFAKGASLVDRDDATLRAKASHLSQDFNLVRLEQRLGPFSLAHQHAHQRAPRTTYHDEVEPQLILMPWATTPEIQALRATHDRLREEWRTTGKPAAQAERTAVRAAGKARLATLRAEKQANSQAITLLENPVTPKSLIRRITNQLCFDPMLVQIKAENRAQLKAVTAAHPHPNPLFRRWLMEQARLGDAMAERALKRIRQTEQSWAPIARIDLTVELAAELAQELAAEAARLERLDQLAEEALDAADLRAGRAVEHDATPTAPERTSTTERTRS